FPKISGLPMKAPTSFQAPFPDLHLASLAFSDPAREASRQKKIAEWKAANPKPDSSTLDNTNQKSKSTVPKGSAWSQQKELKERRKERREKRGRKKEAVARAKAAGTLQTRAQSGESCGERVEDCMSEDSGDEWEELQREEREAKKERKSKQGRAKVEEEDNDEGSEMDV
ncbi:hypothetical protein HDU93_003171, partial [Gonapodya sp. JEL0774]